MQMTDSIFYVYYDNAGSFTDFTANAASQDVLKLVSFGLSSTQSLYIGSEHSFNFKHMYFKTPVSGAALTVKYYTTSYTSVTNLVDNTFNFSQSGHLYWELPTDWKKSTVNGKELYWIKISSTVTKTGFELYTIKNIFSTDDMVLDYLPELNRYLPTGKANFLYLHELAKNEIINNMKASSKIEYEDQVKADSIIALQQLACYKFLELLLLPMIEDQSIKYMYERFSSAYVKMLNEVRLSVDINKDETISPSEANKITFTTIVRV